MRPVRRRLHRPIVNLRAAVDAHEPFKVDYSHTNAFLAECSSFSQLLQEYVVVVKEDIQRREDDYQKGLQMHAEAKVQYERDWEEGNTRLSNMINTLNREAEEEAQMLADVAEHRARRARSRENAAAIASELTEAKGAIARIRTGQHADLRTLEEQIAKVEPELQVFESLLGWSVESVQRDMLLFRFINVDPANPAREFSLVIDVSQKEYKVPTCTPLLPAMPDLVNSLNETGEFYAFVRSVRLAFREYALEERGA